MKLLGYLALAVAVIFVIAVIYGSNMPPELSAAYDKQREAERMCDQMMSDAAPGNERRTTRSICDGLKAKVQAEIDAARRK